MSLPRQVLPGQFYMITRRCTQRQFLLRPDQPTNAAFTYCLMNALRGRWENFWSSEQVCVVKLVGREAVMDKLVYTATNPVQDHLVDRAHHWPGINGLPALLAGRCLRATRPRHFFRPEGWSRRAAAVL